VKEPSLEELLELAAAASGEALDALLPHKSERVVRALIENPNLLELQKIRFLRRRDLSPALFQKIARDKTWVGEYAVRLALAKNPKLPAWLFQEMLAQFLVMDLVKIAADPYVTADKKVFLNRLIAVRVPALPLGTKVNLAKRASHEVIEALLLWEPHERLVRVSLESKYLTERVLIRSIGSAMREPPALSAVAIHKEWGKRHGVKKALAKNPNLIHGHRARILSTLSAFDLNEIYEDCAAHGHVTRAVDEEFAGRPQDGRTRAHRRSLSKEEIEAVLSKAKKKRHQESKDRERDREQDRAEQEAKAPKKKSAGEIRGGQVKEAEGEGGE